MSANGWDVWDELAYIPDSSDSSDEASIPAIIEAPCLHLAAVRGIMDSKNYSWVPCLTTLSEDLFLGNMHDAEDVSGLSAQGVSTLVMAPFILAHALMRDAGITAVLCLAAGASAADKYSTGMPPDIL